MLRLQASFIRFLFLTTTHLEIYTLKRYRKRAKKYGIFFGPLIYPSSSLGWRYGANGNRIHALNQIKIG